MFFEKATVGAALADATKRSPRAAAPSPPRTPAARRTGKAAANPAPPQPRKADPVSRRNSILLVAVAFIAMAGAYWMLILAPKRDEAAALNTQIAAKQAALAAAEAELATYEAARDRLPRQLHARSRASARPSRPTTTCARSWCSSTRPPPAARSTSASINLDGSAGAAPAGSGGTAGRDRDPRGDHAAARQLDVGSAGFSAMPFSFKFNGQLLQPRGASSSASTASSRSRTRSLDVTGRLLLLNSISLQPDTMKGYPLITAEVKANSYLLPPTKDARRLRPPAGPTAAAGAAAGAASPTTEPATTTTATVGVPR